MSSVEEIQASPPIEQTVPRWGPISASYFAFVTLEVLILSFGLPSNGDGTMAFRLGVTASLAFWLACGRAPWWLRLIVVTVAVAGQSLFPSILPWLEALIFGASALIFTGIVFGLRALFSLIDRHSNQHHSISLKGIMVLIVGAASLFLLLRLLSGGNGPLDQSTQLMVFLLQFTCVGVAFQFQCAAVWVSGARFYWWWLGAVFTSTLVMLGAYGLHQLFVGDGRFGEWLEIYGIGSLSIWLAVYPLDTLLRCFGWSLVQPSWYLPQRPTWSEDEPEASPSSTAERYSARDSAVEAVDFDDIV